MTHRDTTVKQRDSMELEIATNDVFPQRSEVLRNPDIDHVSESEIYKGTAPGTILPPVRKKLSANTFQEPYKQQDFSQQTEKEEVIELEISPNLPPEPTKPKFLKNSTETMRGSLKPGIKTYVVMELVDEISGDSELPFYNSGNGKVFGLIIPEESNAFAKGFFKAGSNYYYVNNGSKVSLTPLGVFPSETEARAFFDGYPKNWYTLSPYEIMNIGKWPWVQGAK